MWPASTSSLSWAVWLSYLGRGRPALETLLTVVSGEASVSHFRPMLKLFLCASAGCGDLTGVPVGMSMHSCILAMLHG